MFKIINTIERLEINVEDVTLDLLRDIEHSDEVKLEALKCIELGDMMKPMLDKDEVGEGYAPIQVQDHSMCTERVATDRAFIGEILEMVNRYVGSKQEVLEDYVLSLLNEEDNYTQQDFADRYGVTQVQVSRYLSQFKSDIQQEYGKYVS